MKKNLKQLLSERKDDILKIWFESVVDTYPPDTARLLKREKDPFSNPIGGMTRKSLSALLDELTKEMNRDSIRAAMDPVVRLRAVQSFTASQATGFIFFLKRIIRKTFAGEIEAGRLEAQILDLEMRIDTLAMAAFDVYMGCREKLYELKVNEERNLTYRALRRAGLVSEIPEKESGIF